MQNQCIDFEYFATINRLRHEFDTHSVLGCSPRYSNFDEIFFISFYEIFAKRKGKALKRKNDRNLCFI